MLEAFKCFVFTGLLLWSLRCINVIGLQMFCVNLVVAVVVTLYKCYTNVLCLQGCCCGRSDSSKTRSASIADGGGIQNVLKITRFS